MSTRDSWATPADVFQALNGSIYGPFNVDVCANKGNWKCPFYLGLDSDYASLRDGLKVEWSGLMENGVPSCCWMNPPYSDPYPWMKKASEEAKAGCTVVALVNADHTTQWYKDFIYDYANKCFYPGVTRIDWPKRIKFIPPPGLISKKTGKPVKATTNPFPSMIVVFRPKEAK